MYFDFVGFGRSFALKWMNNPRCLLIDLHELNISSASLNSLFTQPNSDFGIRAAYMLCCHGLFTELFKCEAKETARLSVIIIIIVTSYTIRCTVTSQFIWHSRAHHTHPHAHTCHMLHNVSFPVSECLAVSWIFHKFHSSHTFPHRRDGTIRQSVHVPEYFIANALFARKIELVMQIMEHSCRQNHRNVGLLLTLNKYEIALLKLIAKNPHFVQNCYN